MVQASLEQLKERVALLLKRLAKLQTENAQLQTRLAEQDAQLFKLRQELTGTGKQLLAQGIAASLPDNEAKQKLRGELDRLIAEIDTLLTSLND